MRRQRRKTEGDSPRELVTPELVERCRNGDERAWAELVDATHKEVYTLCLRILRDPHDAAEATQEAYLKAWRGLSGFRGESQFTTWLYRVSANAALTKHRSRRRRQSRELDPGEDAMENVASSASTEDAATARLDVADVERAIALLPEIYRVPLVMRDVYGFSMEEIADQLKISATATKVRLHRARKMLRNAVFGSEGGGEEA